ncbi:hypothetical protein ACTFIY_006272 [Dictyostelium cf. discoideum]
MKTNKGFIYLIVLFIFINFIKSEVINLTDLKQYEKYQTFTSTKTCGFQFNILVKDDSFSIDRIDLENSAPQSLGTYTNFTRFSTNRSTNFMLHFTNVEFGVYENINFTTIVNGLKKEWFILPKFTCYKIDSTKLKVTTMNKINMNQIFIGSKLAGVIKIEGFENGNYPFLLSPNSNPIYSIIKTSSGSSNMGVAFFYVYISNPISILTKYSTLNCIISFFESPSISFNFEADSTINTNDGDISVEILSSTSAQQNGNYQLIGTHSSPYILIKSLANSIFSIHLNNIIPEFISQQSVNERETTYYFSLQKGGLVDYSNKTLQNTAVSINNREGNSIFNHTFSYFFFNLNATFKYQSWSSTSFINLYSQVTEISTMSTKITQMNSVLLNYIVDHPFGLISGNLKNCSIAISITPQPFYPYPTQLSASIDGNQQISYETSDRRGEITKPQMLDYSFTSLYDNYVLLIFNFTSSNPIFMVVIDGFNVFYVNSMVSGTQSNGTFECIFQRQSFQEEGTSSLILIDNGGVQSTFTIGQFYQLPSSTSNKQRIFTTPQFINEISFTNIKFINFKYNDINTTNESYWNTMTLELINSSVSIGEPVQILFYYSNYNDLESYDLKLFLHWNNDKKHWSNDFKLPANLITGTVNYVIITSNGDFLSSIMFSNDWQLRVYSESADLLGPVFSNILKLPPTTINTNGDISFGWNLTISDPINGFSNGHVIIRGGIDNSIYKFYLYSKNGRMELGETHSIVMVIENVTISQEYRITEVLLIDNQNRISEFKEAELDKIYNNPKIVNPFLYYLNDSKINSIQVETGAIYSNDGDFIITNIDTYHFSESIDQINQIRNVNISFTFNQGLISYSIKKNTFPIVYFSSAHFTEPIIKSVCKFNNTSNEYFVNVEIPLNFSYPHKIGISIYGIINNAGYFNGYSSQQMLDTTLTHEIEPYINPMNVNPIIYKVILTNRNSKFIIIGRGFKKNLILSINIKLDSINQPFTNFTIISTTSIELLVNPNLFTHLSISLSATVVGGKQTDEIIIIPIIPDLIQPPIPSLSPIPTSQPQRCQGNPECGGPNNGYCKVGVGCLCYSPFIGIDCTSKIIIVTPPIVNPTKPETTINVPTESNNSTGGNNNNNNNNNVKSIISIVALRELNSITGEEIKIHYFEKWIYTNVSETISHYQSNITTNGNSMAVTNVKAILQWFKNDENITFANQELIMHSSTMKYTIEISPYHFSNPLNNLQIVMSAQIQSNKENTCSDKEFGNTVIDNSNYIKLKVDKNSFYGRYIKRGIIDDRVVSITNQVLDSNYNIKDNENSIQSYIGISIGNFKKSVIIDPDFSILLEQNSATSICNQSSNKSLTKSQLIGIIIGSVAMFIVILIIIGKIIYSSSKCLPLKILIYKMFRNKKY